MFPMLCEDTKGLIPEIYFGLEDIPPYYHLRLEAGKPPTEIVSAIRLIGCGSDCSGYIDEDGVHFHLPQDEVIRVDLSKDFVFVSQPSDPEGASPTAWEVFFFLQEPVRKALFIGERHAVLLEKTEITLKLCMALDQLWAQEAFLEVKQAMVESDEARERGLARLMKVFEDEGTGASSEMWEFWGTFAPLLMNERLGLRVEEAGSKE
jgi:hypothetical protein